MSEQSRMRAIQTSRTLQSADPHAAEKLLPILYEELRSLAQLMMRRLPPGNTLQGTALVHEAYLRLVGDIDPGWKSRSYFFAAAAQAMRRILVEQARRKGAKKHGSDPVHLPANDIDIPIEAPVEDMVALDRALAKLRQTSPRRAMVVDLRYFAGLSIEETAQALDLSAPTVERDWRFARALLYDQLRGHTGTRKSG